MANGDKSYFGRDDVPIEEKRKAWAAGGKKSGETKRKRAEIKKMLSNMEDVRENAITDYIQKNPEAIEMLYAQIFDLALTGEKWAAELVINSTGLSAPKKTEATIKEDEISPDEAKARLMKMMKTEGEG